MDTLPRDLLQEIECPVCFEAMSSPISQCERGHNICSRCRPRLLICPTCRGKFTSVRNITAENLSRLIKHPCRYRSSGCLEEMKCDAIKKHEEKCCFGLNICPFYIVGKCCWEGPMNKMRAHIKREHAFATKYVGFGSMNTQLRWSEENGECCQAMLILDEIFFKYTLLVKSTLYMCIMHVASEEQVDKYKYKMVLRTTDGSESICIQMKCPNYMKFVLKKSLNDRCMAMFHTAFARRCVNSEGKLSYMVEIMN